jgi:hypothetical protein
MSLNKNYCKIISYKKYWNDQKTKISLFLFFGNDVLFFGNDERNIEGNNSVQRLSSPPEWMVS